MFLAAFGTAVHMVGTYLARWPTDRFGARRVLVTATLLRGVVLAGIPLAMALGRIDLTWAMACYRAEGLILGDVDTSVHTVPLELAGHRAELLDRINLALWVGIRGRRGGRTVDAQRPATCSSRNGRLAATARTSPAHGGSWAG